MSWWQVTVGLICAGVFTNACAASLPVDILREQRPTLYKLYADHHSYRDALGEYAYRQGFRKPFENLGTVVHEMLHITSAVHQGFYIDGIYYEPYVRPDAWLPLRNKDVRNYMVGEERGPIYSVYAANTPQNSLGNVLDEINAYSHVAAFICRNEPESSEKQVRNLVGHLHLQEAYLRTGRTFLPQDYLKMAESREARGAIETLFGRAVQALRACGVADVGIPSREVTFFLTVKRSTKK